MLKRRAERGEQEGGLRGLSGLSQREALVLFSFPLHCSHHPPRLSPPLRSGGGRGRGQASAHHYRITRHAPLLTSPPPATHPSSPRSAADTPRRTDSDD